MPREVIDTNRAENSAGISHVLEKPSGEKPKNNLRHRLRVNNLLFLELYLFLMLDVVIVAGNTSLLLL